MDIRGFDSDNDILHILHKSEIVHGDTKLFPSELIQYFCNALKLGGLLDLWGSFDEDPDIGMPCRYLKNGHTWQKGRVVIKIEFVPDPDEIPDTKEIDQPRW